MNNLKALRKQAGMRASELADAIGVTRATVYMWEKDDRKLSPDRAKQALAALAKRGVYATLDTMYAASLDRAA